MAKRPTGKVPDAWEDDDWEVQADKAAAVEDEEPEPQQQQQQPQLSRAERLAQHAESNRKLWESAEAPAETFHYLASRSDPPLATGFKPAVKVLSRKPLQDAGDLDEEDGKKTPQLTPEEIQAKQQRERDEKQRRYDEARAKIFGSNQSSGTSTPGAVTPPRSADGRGPRGRGRGGRGGGGGHRHNESRGDRDRERERDNTQRPSSQSGGGSGRELYDPNCSPKPGFQVERRGNNYNNDGGAPLSRRPTPQEEQVIRAPRGPDGSGRGGFGFAKRGAKGS
ncbi:uncharacterized protein GGS22DRAFT_70783 [Annulohypoxylon maeteangense]|uniref:uncharacterized protein n=1 Tax=Annulohypoxylon maeteangense TaxID=1927788 RepID=UPI00200819ED|nr:uncharacterized protein GGS22DRAFT_70783 [Annulohypoxylon maeteangense]KAI0889410.1 hypothetical protein GGS22DRAFT_70783 [Annulohypoxylon maeteangense]